MVVSADVVSTVKVRVDGVVSVLLPSSVARTAKLCWPSLRFDVVKGDEHGANGSPSTEHSKVELGSSELNVKVGVESLVRPPSAGPELIVVSGLSRSTVKVRLAGVWSVLPKVSVARTSKVCWPSERTPVL